MGAKKENTYENYVHADASGSSNAMKMYLIGIVLYKYREILREKNKNHIFYLIVYIICSAIMALLKIYFNTELGEMIDTYNNPIVVIQAICMFEFF